MPTDPDYVRHVPCGTPVELRWMPPRFRIVGIPEEQQLTNVMYCPTCQKQVPTTQLSSSGPYVALWPVSEVE